MAVILNDNPVSIELDISEALTQLQIQPSDVTAVAFMVKKSPELADNEALISKFLSGSGITLTNSKFYINFEKADFNNLEVGKSYFMGVGIKHGSLNDYLELEFENNAFEIRQDLIRE